MKTILQLFGIATFAVFLYAGMVAWFATINRRVKRLFAMINQVFSVTPTKTRNALFPATVTLAGTPMLLGSLPCVNLDSYQANVGGATNYFDGAYSLTVSAVSTISPQVGKNLNPGDPIYAVGGTLDTATNVTTGFTLCAQSANGVLFGYIDPTQPQIPSGTLGATAIISLANLI